MCEITECPSRTTIPSQATVTHLAGGGSSPLSLLTFFAAAKKVSAAPHRGNANRPLTMQEKANARTGESQNPQRTDKSANRQKIKPAEGNTQQQHPKPLHPRQQQQRTESRQKDTPPDTAQPPPANPSAHAHLAQKTQAQQSQQNTRRRQDHPTAVGKSGSINSRNANKTAPASAPRAARNLISKPLKRLPPPHIPRAMRKQNNSMRSHDKGP